MHSTRRSVLAGLAVPAAAAVAAATALPALAGEPHPDAALLDLGRRFLPAEAAYRASLRRLDEMEAEHVAPERPEAVYVAEADHKLGLGGYANERETDGRRWYRLPSPRAERQGLRRRHFRYEERIATEADRAPVGDVIARRVPWPEAQARADEIVAAYDGWVAECDRAEAACGLTAAYDLSDRLGEALSDVETAIEDATASTLDGVLVKARFVRRDIDIGSKSSTEIIEGLIRDLLALGGSV